MLGGECWPQTKVLFFSSVSSQRESWHCHRNWGTFSPRGSSMSNQPIHILVLDSIGILCRRQTRCSPISFFLSKLSKFKGGPYPGCSLSEEYVTLHEGRKTILGHVCHVLIEKNPVLGPTVLKCHLNMIYSIRRAGLCRRPVKPWVDSFVCLPIAASGKQYYSLVAVNHRLDRKWILLLCPLATKGEFPNDWMMKRLDGPACLGFSISLNLGLPANYCCLLLLLGHYN